MILCDAHVEKLSVKDIGEINMGGRCFVNSMNNNGAFQLFNGPECTDNFQIVTNQFTYLGIRWHSVEQAFQSLKFPIGSTMQIKIQNEAPWKNESSDEYGHRIWAMGQEKLEFPLRNDWAKVKIKLMTLINLAKYASNLSFRTELDSTGNNRLLSRNSTWKWPYWNANIQMYIRKLVRNNVDLNSHLEVLQQKLPNQVEQLLIETGRFKSDGELFRTYRNSNFLEGSDIYIKTPPEYEFFIEGTNTSMSLWDGELILCDVRDFPSTFKQFQPDSVFTMCSKPPKFENTNKDGCWFHRDFRGYDDIENYDVLGCVVVEVMNDLKNGKRVLLHCLEGQDRTGIVGLTLIRLFHPEKSFREYTKILSNARPARIDYWFKIQGMLSEASLYNNISNRLAMHILD